MLWEESVGLFGSVDQSCQDLLFLTRTADGVNDGEIVFGSADTSKFDASTTQVGDLLSTETLTKRLQTLPASSPNGFWQAAMGAVTVNGKVVASERQAVLDSGKEANYGFGPRH